MSSVMLCRCRYRQHLYRLVRPLVYARTYHATPSGLNIAQKYLKKLEKRAEEQGVSVDELRQKVKEVTKPRPLPEAQFLQEAAKKLETNKTTDGELNKTLGQNERKDESPVKPLAEIMDIHKVLRTPHTPEKISALWTAFHASRSGGTGRGYLSASIPLPTYEKLLEFGRKYPTFILPLMREASQSEFSESSSEKNGAEAAYEFFFMQWLFHPAPPVPAPSIFDAPLPKNAIPLAPAHPVSTVLFTPLLEYKTHSTFATPHLVLTIYPDLLHTHQLALLRGELTPSPGGNGRYLLSQQDAQLLALGLQRFYLAHGNENHEDTGRKERAELVKVFNEKPKEFRWEELLKHASPTS